MTQSSYLMSFIKTLMETDSRENRELKRRELETDFDSSGAKLHSRLAENYNDVSNILTVYRDVSEKIKENKLSIVSIKTDLTECKTLLQCNRDELRRMWLDHVEKSRCVELLEYLDKVKDSPERIQSLVVKKTWKEATDEYETASKLLKDELNCVQALNAVKTDLTVKHKNLVDQLKQDLHRQIFVRPSTTALHRFHREEWLRHSQRSSARSTHKTKEYRTQISTSSSNTKHSATTTCRHYRDLELGNWRDIDVAALMTTNHQVTSSRDVFAKSTAGGGGAGSCRKTSSSDWLENIVNAAGCMDRLKKLANLISDWREPGGLQAQLHKYCVLPAVQEINNNAIALGDPSPLSNHAQPRYLTELLEILFDTLFMATSANLLLIRTINYLQSIDATDNFRGFDEDFVRMCVMNEIKELLAVHLDVMSAGLAVTSTSSLQLSNTLKHTDPNSLDLTAFFGKRRLGQILFSAGKKGLVLNALTSSTSGGDSSTAGLIGMGHQEQHTTTAMFSFSASSHALSVNSYMREHNINKSADSQNASEGPASAAAESSLGALGTASPSQSEGRQALLVCTPSHGNITAVFTTLMEFIRAFEEDTTSAPNDKTKPCELRTFVVQFIENIYLPEVLTTLKHKIENSMRSSESFHTPISPKTEKELALSKPILEAVLIAQECLSEVHRLSQSLPNYAPRCLHIGIEVLKTFMNLIWKGYKEISRNPDDDEDELLVSAEWAKDEDILRFWTKFPSWIQMVANEEKSFVGLSSSAVSNCPSRTSAYFLNAKSSLSNMPSSRKSETPLTGNSGNPSNDLSSLGSQETAKLLHLIHDRFDQSSPATVKENHQLKKMACLHESMAWLSHKIYSFEQWLNGMWREGDLLEEVSPSMKQNLTSLYALLSSDVNHVANSCLLMVHLECRLLAYNHFTMLPEPQTYWCPLDEVDVDPHVTKFINALTKQRDILAATLSPHKLRFVFDSLGHFISMLLIKTMSNITRMNGNGIKKMCRNIYHLQQALSVLTCNHETELVRVKQLYELLHLTPDAVLNRIMEQGAVYEEAVYREVLLLYQRSHPTHEHSRFQECLSRLREVIHMKNV